jgi:hypothetical protein
MRLIIPMTALLLFGSCGGQDAVADPCVMRVDVIAPEPVRVGGTRVVEVDVVQRSGNCASLDKEIAWRSSATDVIEITSSTQTSATIVARRQASASISAWLIQMPAVRDSVTIAVGPLVDN